MAPDDRLPFIRRAMALMSAGHEVSARSQARKHAAKAARLVFDDGHRYERTIDWQYAARAYNVPARWAKVWATTFRLRLFALSQYRRTVCPGCWIHPATQLLRPHWHCRCGISLLVEQGRCTSCGDVVRV